MTKEPAKDPVGWLFSACLMLLGCAIALTLAVDLLSSIWGWLLGIGLVVATIAVVIVALRIRADRRQKW